METRNRLSMPRWSYTVVKVAIVTGLVFSCALVLYETISPMEGILRLAMPVCLLLIYSLGAWLMFVTTGVFDDRVYTRDTIIFITAFDAVCSVLMLIFLRFGASRSMILGMWFIVMFVSTNQIIWQLIRFRWPHLFRKNQG